MTYTLPQLPYALDALEPTISKAIMDLHYNKHHKAYVDNLNKALAEYHEAEKKNDLAKMISLQSAIKFNGGGHLNHSIFWTNLTPDSTPPSGQLASALKEEFGSIDKFIETFNSIAGPIQGSGWAWLGFKNGGLQIVTCANQDPCVTTGCIPLLGIDVWEHAYYLQYKNVRPDYLKAIWNVINWKNVEERYARALGTVGAAKG